LEFEEEQGTGLGPTLEFYSLVAGEFQRTDLAMWLCEDDLLHTHEALDLGDGCKWREGAGFK
jgi:E3 ubiquitin-protein ligase HECTD1